MRQGFQANWPAGIGGQVVGLDRNFFTLIQVADTMSPVLSAALQTLCQERDSGEYSAAFEAVSALVNEYGECELANRLFEEIPGTVPFELVAELFNLLVWQTNDNGDAITQTAESWLCKGSDIRKLRIALNLDVYPFLDEVEMRQVLSALANARDALNKSAFF